MRKNTWLDVVFISVGVLVAAFLIVPVVISILGSFSAYWTTSLFSQGFTLKWYQYVWENYGHTIRFSVMIAVFAVVADVLIGVPLGYALTRSNSRWMKLLEEITALPVAVPGTAVALALVQTHAFMRGSWLFLAIGHVVVTLPLVVRPVAAAMRTAQLRALEEAAASLGASRITRLLRVVFPNIRGAILAGALMALTMSMGEFNLTFFLYTPLTMTMPVGLYESYASLRIEIGSAYTTIFLAITLPLMLLVQYLGGESTLRARGGGV